VINLKISVIVPVYNVRDYIVKCIESILKQTFKNFEIIVVNDGTCDDSIKLIEKNFDDDRIKIIYKKNGGLASARNTGVTYARGEYLFFVDSDDFIKPNTLEVMYKRAISGNHDLVLCDYYKYYNDSNYELIPLIHHFNLNDKKSIITAMPGAVCRLIKKNLYLEYDIKFLENHFFEDNAVMPFLSAVSKNPYYIKESFYYYLQRDKSILNQSTYNKKWEDIFSSLENLKNKFLEYNLLDSCYSELEYIYIEYLLHAANLRFLDYKEGLKNIKKVSLVMNREFKNFRKNKYYKKENIKYKIMCNLFYYKQISILKLIRRIKHG